MTIFQSKNDKRMKRNNKFSFSYIIFSLIITLPLCVSVKASTENEPTYGLPAQEFAHDPNLKLIALAGTKSQTRISFLPYAIKEVVGDSNKYKIIHDAHGTSIFLMPKVKAGEKIDLTIISAGGKTQDILLNVKDCEGSVILIKPKSDVISQTTFDNKFIESISKRKLDEAKKLLKAMNYGIKGKYDVTDFGFLNSKSCKRQIHKIECNRNLIAKINNSNEHGLIQDLEIIEKQVYRYKVSGLKGVVLEIQNNQNQISHFSEEQIAELFSGSLLTSSKSNQIPAKGYSYAYVVINADEEL